MTSVVEPVRMLLKLYHDDVMRRCTLMFKSSKRSVLAREIHSRMVELDPTAAECRIGRIYYWLAPLKKIINALTHPETPYISGFL